MWGVGRVVTTGGINTRRLRPAVEAVLPFSQAIACFTPTARPNMTQQGAKTPVVARPLVNTCRATPGRPASAALLDQGTFSRPPHLGRSAPLK